MILELSKVDIVSQKETTQKAFSNLEKTLDVLKKIQLPTNLITVINHKIEVLNSFQNSERKYRNKLIIEQHNILQLVKKETGYVSEKYYQKQWFVLGMSIFGIPFGLLFSYFAGNTGLLGIGFPIGMLLGAMVGKRKDEKIKREGKQLQLTLN